MLFLAALLSGLSFRAHTGRIIMGSAHIITTILGRTITPRATITGHIAITGTGHIAITGPIGERTTMAGTTDVVTIK